MEGAAEEEERSFVAPSSVATFLNPCDHDSLHANTIALYALGLASSIFVSGPYTNDKTAFGE